MIRAANESDIPAILDMGARFYAATSYAGFSDYCHDSVAVIVRMMLADGVLLLAEHEGEAVGMVGLCVAPFHFNHAHRTAHEVMWWVDPEARSTGAGVALLQAVEPACREKGVTAIQMMTLADSPRHAGQLYERQGYRLTENAFTKVL